MRAGGRGEGGGGGGMHLLGHVQRPAAVVHQAQLAAAGGEALVRVVAPQQQPEFRPAGQHPVRLPEVLHPPPAPGPLLGAAQQDGTQLYTDQPWSGDGKVASSCGVQQPRRLPFLWQPGRSCPRTVALLSHRHVPSSGGAALVATVHLMLARRRHDCAHNALCACVTAPSQETAVIAVALHCCQLA